MNKEQFFESLCNTCITEQDKIAAILLARGVLIEKIDGRYYLSDNADIGDVDYLARVVEAFQLGKVVDSGKRVTRRRRSWRDDDPRCSYEYESLVSQGVEIIFDRNVDVRQAAALFEDQKRIGCEAGANRIGWPQYTREVLPTKVSLSILEPYVAFYVKAVSACGVFTASACDGNHRDGGRIIVESHSPSDIWHKCIWEYLVRPRFGPLLFIGTGIPFTSNDQYEKYLLINQIASFLYDNRIAIRERKTQSVSRITKKYRKKRTDTEIIRFYEDECRRVLTAGTDVLI